MTNQDMKRGIYLLIIGIVVASFIIFNSPDFFSSGILYIIMGTLTIGGYLIFPKI
ncbi:MAG: hypothetical protein AABY22_12175 [Nanoarchaeota archaeon]